jgi:hypothetical protein
VELPGIYSAEYLRSNPMLKKITDFFFLMMDDVIVYAVFQSSKEKVVTAVTSFGFTP